MLRPAVGWVVKALFYEARGVVWLGSGGWAGFVVWGSVLRPAVALYTIPAPVGPLSPAVGEMAEFQAKIKSQSKARSTP